MNNTTQSKIIDVLQYVPGCIYWKDINGVYLGCNKAEVELLGLNSTQEIIGKTDYELMSKNEADSLRKIDQRIMRNGVPEEILEKFTNINGKLAVMLTKKSPLYDNKNNVIGVIGVSIDITERKAKEELDTKLGIQSYVNNILQHVPVCIYWKDTSGVYSGCNLEEAKILGFNSPEEVIGKTDYDLSWKYEAEVLQKTDSRIMRSGVPEEIFERLTNGNGKEILMLTRKSPFYDDKNNVIGIVGVSIDITERKEKERLETELKLQKKLCTIAKEVAHDIASPVSTLKMMEHMYKNKLAEKDLKMLSSVVLSVEGMVKKLMEKYKDMEDFDRGMVTSDKGPCVTHIQPYYCLCEVIEAKRYQLEFTKSNTVLNFYPDEESKTIFIKGDYSDFCRMVINLLNNSVESLEDRNGVVDVSLRCGKEVKISVKDSGSGMSKEMVEQIISGMKVCTTKSYGHGIGTQQVRKTIESMRGQLAIKSEIGTGTEFTISFPKAMTPAWWVQKIELNKGDTVMILDESIVAQDAWKKRFIKFRNYLTIKYFSNTDEARSFISSLENKNKSFLITEYKFKSSLINGIDIIKESGMQNRSVLATEMHFSKIKDFDENFGKFGFKFLHKLFLGDVVLVVE